MPESNLTPLTCYGRRFPSEDSDRKRLIARHFRRCIIHLKRQQAKRGKKKNIRKCCLIISVCTFRNREVSFVEVPQW